MSTNGAGAAVGKDMDEICILTNIGCCEADVVAIQSCSCCEVGMPSWKHATRSVDRSPFPGSQEPGLSVNLFLKHTIYWSIDEVKSALAELVFFASILYLLLYFHRSSLGCRRIVPFACPFWLLSVQHSGARGCLRIAAPPTRSRNLERPGRLNAGSTPHHKPIMRDPIV